MKKNELEIIKEGKTGHGILIEKDGFLSLDKKTVNEGIEDGEWHVPNPFIVDAVFQKYGIKNANGRIYPEAILKREVEKYQQKINERRAYGEANHPADSTINLSRISYNIIELHWENATLVGKLEINTSEGFRRNGIITSCGDEIANLLLNGYKIGVSSRGVGSVEQKLGQYLVGDDFELICWDIVSDPSTPGAYIGNRDSLQQYVEVKTQEKPSISEKINKIKNILNS
jgi:hypothetical protein